MNTKKKIFKTLVEDGRTKARRGILSLPHGDVETPVFMPVGTNGTVKAMTHQAPKTAINSFLL